MNVKLRRDCVIYAMIALFIALVYSYKNAVWVNEQYAMYFKRGDTSTPIYMMLVYSALIAMFFASIPRICKNRWHFLYGAFLILTVMFYFVKALLEEGVYSALTSPTTPLVYLLSLAVFVGMDDKVWDAVRRILPLLVIAYICLLIYEYIMLVARYGIVVVGNSSIIYFYVSLFWCTVIYLTDRILCNENIGLLQVLLIGFNIIFAVVIKKLDYSVMYCWCCCLFNWNNTA